jgi:allatostatin receptor
LIGNALVVAVIVANSRMRSTTNLLIANLAIADLLFIVFCVPFTASDYALLFWPFGEVWCKIVQYLVIVTAYASIYTLVLMSLDRYLIVVHPLSSICIRTKTNTYWAIAITWVFLSNKFQPFDFSVPTTQIFIKN